MKFKQATLAAAALTLLATSASAVEWGGYARVGPGQKQNERCFNGGGAGSMGSAAPGHGGIGRLGNECATYGEFQLSQGMKAGNVDYKALLMTNFFSDGGSEADGILTHVNQLYVEGKGYDVAPSQTFWIGRRFYHRADVHMDDSFYVNMSGTGAGVDGIPVGAGQLSLAVFRTNDTNFDSVSNSRFNFDIEKLPVNPGGQFRITGSFTSGGGDLGENGAGISLQHIQSGIFGGADNTLWFQYAQGSASLDQGFGDPTADSDRKSWRIADSIAWLKGPLTAQTLFHYGHAEDADLLGNKIKARTFSIAGRLGYAITKNFKLQGELGFADTKPEGQGSRKITKFTIAPTLTVGPDFYDRPELRFYVSTFSANDNYQLANGLEKKNRTAVGFQAEIWF
jgi:maltoporin